MYRCKRLKQKSKNEYKKTNKDHVLHAQTGVGGGHHQVHRASRPAGRGIQQPPTQFSVTLSIRAPLLSVAGHSLQCSAFQAGRTEVCCEDSCFFERCLSFVPTVKDDIGIPLVSAGIDVSNFVKAWLVHVRVKPTPQPWSSRVRSSRSKADSAPGPVILATWLPALMRPWLSERSLNCLVTCMVVINLGCGFSDVTRPSRARRSLSHTGGWKSARK